MCVCVHREVCLLAVVELNFESVVQLLVCVMMTIIIIMTMTIIMSSPVRGLFKSSVCGYDDVFVYISTLWRCVTFRCSLFSCSDV